MSQSLVDALGQFLAAAGVGAYSTTAALPAGVTPISLGMSPETSGPSGSAVTLTPYPGPEPDSRNGWEYPRLQVRVRHETVPGCLDLDDQVYRLLQAPTPQVLPGATWWLQDAYSLQSDAQQLGPDGNGRLEYVRNFQLTTERT